MTKHHFPEYQAVYLYRADLKQRAPAVVEALNKVVGRINERDMITMNEQAKLKRLPEERVAADFLASSLKIRSNATAASTTIQILNRTAEHLFLVSVSSLPPFSLRFRWDRRLQIRSPRPRHPQHRGRDLQRSRRWRCWCS
jgi:osmoprotectant transport system permease protein